MSERWSNEELKASVDAYIDMLQKYRSGIHIVKKEYYEFLSHKFGRAPKAFEYRMQNISFVYSLLGREWLPGLRPAKNVGANIAARIEALISETEGKYLTPQAKFEVQVKELQAKYLARPLGIKIPVVSISSVSQFSRDPAVKAWILNSAQGVCECCGKPAPFKGADGQAYLEVHHVRRLADGGSDTVENAIAVCPNCHRALHYSAESVELVENLYKNISRLIHE